MLSCMWYAELWGVYTELHMVYCQVVRLLVVAGADVEAKDQLGRTALMYCAWYGHLLVSLHTPTHTMYIRTHLFCAV